MKNARTRKLLALLALSVPMFLAARGAAVGGLGGIADTALEAAEVPAHMSGSVIDLWYLWALRHGLVPAGVQVAGLDASMNKAQQESQP